MAVTYKEAQALLARVEAATRTAMTKTVVPPPGALLVHGQATTAIQGAYKGLVTLEGAEAAVREWEETVEKMEYDR